MCKEIGVLSATECAQTRPHFKKHFKKVDASLHHARSCSRAPRLYRQCIKRASFLVSLHSCPIADNKPFRTDVNSKAHDDTGFPSPVVATG